LGQKVGLGERGDGARYPLDTDWHGGERDRKKGQSRPRVSGVGKKKPWRFRSKTEVAREIPAATVSHARSNSTIGLAPIIIHQR